MRKWMIPVLLGLTALSAGCGVEQRDEAKISQQSPSMTVTAQHLYADYAADALDAKARYNKKVILVTGIVGTTGDGVTGNPWVKINTGSARVSVECMFAPKHKDEIRALKQGQTVSIKGKVSEKMTDIFLHGCTLQ